MAAVPSLGVRLLADLRTVFGDREHMLTHEILAALNGMEEAPWGDIHGKPLDARGLSRRLSRYGVERQSVRVGDATGKGYSRADLDDPWSRYVTHCDPKGPSVTPTLPESDLFMRIGGGSEERGQTQQTDVTQQTAAVSPPPPRKWVTSVTSVTEPALDRFRTLAAVNEPHR